MQEQLINSIPGCRVYKRGKHLFRMEFDHAGETYELHSVRVINDDHTEITVSSPQFEGQPVPKAVRGFLKGYMIPWDPERELPVKYILGQGLGSLRPN